MTFTPPKPLDPGLLYTPCDPDGFDFETTADLPALDDVVGQDRAVQAVSFAIGMRHRGFNLFALGPEGTGKKSLITRFLRVNAATEPLPDDWCYVNNFADPHKPRALRLPPGRGRPLRDDMVRLVEELGSAISAAFESDEYRNRKSVIEDHFKEQHEDAFARIQKRAQDKNVTLIRTPVGLALAPVKDGEVLNPQEFEALSDEEKAMRKEAIEELQHALEETLRRIPRWEKEQREELKGLNRDVTMYAVGYLIDELKKSWADVPGVLEYLDAVRDDVVENVDDFLPQSDDKGGQTMMIGGALFRVGGGGPSFRRYQVNVLVDNACPPAAESSTTGAPKASAGGNGGDAPCGAPVLYEDHPTVPNLIGRIEHQSQLGTLVTDFNLIKAGALHRANGGYLVLDARKLLMQPYAWETLKRALQSGHVRIESLGEALGWVGTTTLEPEPIPLQVKVMLLGEPMLYYLLARHDPDFHDLFKVAADFDTRMGRDADSAGQYARLIATVAAQEGLAPLDRTAVARVVEHGARLADDAERLTTNMGRIVDLAREADYWARTAGAGVVAAEHVQRAIDAQVYRSDRIRQRIQEEIQRGTLTVETAGERVGQVNGLAVLQLDHFSFGRPSRISCQIRLGKGEMLDIEREVALGGPLHSKGVLILTAYLGSRYAKEEPMALQASLVFEQSYGGVDGDSASSAELYALISAISGIALRQSLAVTGSVDQYGTVQAIGGVNEKIEGFFDVCKARGLTGDQGVLIPATNVKHLMLRADVVEAARAGRFHIHPVATIDRGLEILTGLSAGIADDKGAYPIGTVNRAVVNGLARLTRKAKALAGELAGGGRNGTAQEPHP